VLPLLCPVCGGELRIIAFLTDPAPVRAILDHLGLPNHPPPLAPGRGPPAFATEPDLDTSDFDFDQSPAFDPTNPEPIPEFEFDQRRRT